MNPEEGELRPQLLDRFGLAVSVTALRLEDVSADTLRGVAIARRFEGRAA